LELPDSVFALVVENTLSQSWLHVFVLKMTEFGTKRRRRSSEPVVESYSNLLECVSPEHWQCTVLMHAERCEIATLTLWTLRHLRARS
jgi:hypothetical protein